MAIGDYIKLSKSKNQGLTKSSNFNIRFLLELLQQYLPKTHTTTSGTIQEPCRGAQIKAKLKFGNPKISIARENTIIF